MIRTESPARLAAPRVRLHQRQGNEVLVRAHDEHLGDAEGEQADRRGLLVALGHGGRRAAEQGGDDRVAAQGLVSLDVRGHIDRPGQVDHAAHRQGILRVHRAGRRQASARRRPHRQVPAGGVPDEHDTTEVERICRASVRR